MMREIIKIDETKCNGCGICVSACHEGAIGLVDGKAKLLRDDYCDGLGNCLPTCPTSAISFEKREAAEYDEAAVSENQRKAKLDDKIYGRVDDKIYGKVDDKISFDNQNFPVQKSNLAQWPVQIKLVPTNAAYFNKANLLIAADCTAYAYGNFHNAFMDDRITLIACPKLDDCDYSEKLTEILKQNDINSIKIVRMEVPCCGGIVYAVNRALENCGKTIAMQIVTVTTDGKILND